MAPQITKRQPLSCENCRKRKIKCTGERPACETCARRGFSHTCFYLRQSSQAPSSTCDEVLQRVKRVEALLERQMTLLEHHRFDGNATMSSSSQPDVLSQQPSSSSLNSSPWTEVDVSNAHLTPTTSVNTDSSAGAVLTSAEGYQRFIPGLAASDAEAVNEMIQPTSTPALGTSFPFSTESTATRESLLHALPPDRQCEELKHIFFEVFSPLFHVLHDPTFHAEYAEFRQRKGEVSLSFLALVFVIFSIGVTSLDEDHPLLAELGLESSASANIKSLAAKYRASAMRCLSADSFLWQHNLHTVQALILLVYAISHAHGPSWALLGMTFNITVSVGCHIDPAQLNLDPVESEQRRRCWAALMMLYTIQNTCLGNIAPMKITANVRLPADVDDENVGQEEVPPQISEEFQHRPPTKMSYVLFKFKLYQLASDICQSARGNADVNTTLELDARISREEEQHAARFAHLQHLPMYHLAHQRILRNYTDHLRLILHRPYLTPQAAALSGGVLDLTDQVSQSRQYCRKSAMAILANHEELYELEDFRPYRWFVYGIASFQAFLAASTLIVLLASENVNDESEQATIVGVLRRCLLRFERMAARSDVCSKAVPILRRLLSPSPQRTSARGTPESCPGACGSAKDELEIRHRSELQNLSEDQLAPGRGIPVPPPPPLAELNLGGQVQPTPFGGAGNSSTFFNCPQQIHDLVQLPAEQWLGGPAALAWNWNWSDQNGFSDSFFMGSEMFLDNTNMMMCHEKTVP